MRPEIIDKLFSLNREFYQSFGASFAQTRRRVQPGVRHVLSEYIYDGDWLDIGCGSAALAQEWGASGRRGSYTGIDFSLPLLQEAAAGLAQARPAQELRVSFKEVDLASANWADALERQIYDGIVSFAVLHHIPSAEKRRQLVRQVAGLLKPQALFILSCWQFQHNPKLVARIQPWGVAGIDPHDVEGGDTLLDWRHQIDGANSAPGLRYVHLFSRQELAALAESAGFEVLTEFESDGKGGRLGLYQVWRLRTS